MDNIYDEIDFIVKKFGGENRKDLRIALLVLIEEKFDELKLKIGAQLVNEIHQKQLITDILRLNSSNYDKVLRIIDRLIPGKWYNRIIIPDDFYIDFLLQATSSYDIEFETRLDKEFFRIVENKLDHHK